MTKNKKKNKWFQPSDLSIPDMIQLNSYWIANQPALVCESQSKTWKELAETINKLGNSLYSMGLNKGDRVVLMTKNSIEMMESILSVICAGLVVVPLNISITDDAVVTMICNCNARAVIASDEFVSRINNLLGELPSDSGLQLISINESYDNWQNYNKLIDIGSSNKLNVDIEQDDECNIIYSSGTTGMPKGIVHSHGCRFAWAQGMSISLRYTTGARTLLTLGLYSNISWVAFLNTILVGGTMYIAPKFDAKECLRQIQQDSITHFAMVPVQYQMLLDHESFSQYDLSSIEATMCCGSPLTVEMKQRLLKHLPGDFIELYGLTEGLVTILDPEQMTDKINSVGLPYPGQNIQIIDNNNMPVKSGEAGEIVGISKILMSGYLDNEQANKEATWLDENNRRWLRTGDIGKLDDDGFLYLVDRKKDMIISGGQNVFPADIEAVLSQRPEIKELAVIGVKSKKWGETPIAIIVSKSNTEINCDEVKNWLNAKVGKQQRVAKIVMVDNLPRNPAGKVLKRELRNMFASLEF